MTKEAPTARKRAHAGLRQHTFAQYKRINALNHSTLDRIRKTPRHLQHYLRHGDEDSTAKLLGRALHTLVLEPKRESENLVVWEHGDRRGNDWKAFALKHADKDIVKTSEYENVGRIRDAIFAKQSIREKLEGATHEGTALWTDPVTGLACKARMDCTRETVIYDLKSTSDLRRFGKTAHDLGYHRKASWYLDGASLATGRAYTTFGLIVVEDKEPYESIYFEYTPESLDLGRRENRESVEFYAWCVTNNQWPGYPEETAMLDATRWA